MDLHAPHDVELSGTWRAAPADDELRRLWADPEFDVSGWEAVDVPGHWRSVPAFATSDGPLLYRTSFELRPPPTGPNSGASAGAVRHWLELDGLFSQGDVWLDGAYLGNTDGYFAPHRFEVSDQVADRSEHTLAVEVTSDPPGDPASKRSITGVWMDDVGLDPTWNPGGIWRPVRLSRTGPVAIVRLRVLCTEATAERAVVSLDATLDSPDATSVQLRTSVAGTDHRVDQPLAAGQNRVRWTVTVDRPALWWPHSLGEAVLHDLRVAVVAGRVGDSDGAGAVSDERRMRTGLRTVSMRNWIASVNGERLFLKGASVLPTRQALAEATGAEIAADVDLAVDCGLDLLRVHAHVARPELYAAADEAGMLLWQDLPLRGGYNRSVRRQAVAQARAAVDLLGHHPSVAMWCGHDEPFAHPVDPSPRSRPSFTVARLVAAQELPTWNRTVLDRSVRRALSGADPSRPVMPHSGVLPHPPQLDGSASHFSFGWEHGDVRDLALAARAVPRAVRFVGRFGAPAVPDSAEFADPEAWPALDWEELEAHHGYRPGVFERRVPPRASATFEVWRQASQHLQAEVVRREVEVLRRLKYRPTGGFVVFALADAHPSFGWGVVDHARVPKAAHAALVAACAPIIVVADLPPTVVRPGDEVALEVHVVNDRRTPLEEAEVEVHARGAGVERTWRFGGRVDADSVARVGRIVVTPDRAGEVTVELTLSGGAPAANTYRFAVTPD